MTKADIAALVAEKGLTKKQAMEAVEATLGLIKNTLQKGEKIQLVGFGSFQIRAKRARKGRNPRPARRSPSRLARCSSSSRASNSTPS